jgi:polygalacturonase
MNTLTTIELQERIDASAASGGGEVRVPPGEHVVGSVQLRSGVRLYLEAGAVLVASPDPVLYPVLARTENKPGQIQALLYADQAQDIAVGGPGIIEAWGSEKISWEEAGAQTFRPALFFFRDCRNLKFSEFTARHGVFWSLHLLRCEDVEIRGLTMRHHRPNSDGIDPDGCRRVRIENCDLQTGDDCIVLKSTEGDDCEDILVRGCRLSTMCAALKLGTESLGTIRRVRFEQCRIENSQEGMALFMKDGGRFQEITFEEIEVEAASPFPLIIDATPRHDLEASPGSIEQVDFRRIHFRSPGRALIRGRKGYPVRGIRLSEFTWEITRGGPPFAETEFPVGAARITLDPDRNRFATEPAQFLLADVEDIRFESAQMREVDSGVQSRDPLFTYQVDGVQGQPEVPAI